MATDRDVRNRWIAGNLAASAPASSLPFSFRYDGHPSAELLATWNVRHTRRRLRGRRIERTVAWTDPATGLQVRCVSVTYGEFPAVEWTVYFRNTGSADTAILEDIEAVDHRFAGGPSAAPRLRFIDGDAVEHGFAPREMLLGNGAAVQFAPANGRPTDRCFPYYNLDWGGHGVIVVVGWPGQWKASFTGETDGGVRVRAGQELGRFRLHPGEEARSPLMVLMFWEGGDWLDAQNAWRRWMRAHNMPKPGGKDVPVLRAATAPGEGLTFALKSMNERDQVAFIDRHAEEGIRLTHWWIDIYGGSTNFLCTDGQYLASGAYKGAPGLYLARDWNADRANFPRGLRAVSDRARAKGMRLIVWYEPEHVWPGYSLFEHPDWLLSAPSDPATRTALNQGCPLGDRRLLNLGHPDALAWAIEHFSGVLAAEGIDVYRQDFNLEPLVFWRHGDAPDRQGMCENLYVQGYLRFWDGLLERRPGLLIDGCASGGRRNDVETLRRSVPLWRSDTGGDPVILQEQTYGLALWIPYFGTGTGTLEEYDYRSSLGASLVTSWDVRKPDLEYPRLRRLEEQFWRIAPYFVEDYYPLTEFRTTRDVWMAWQFNRPGRGDGIVQSFRREQCTESRRQLRLRGLDGTARYRVTELGAEASVEASGHDLMERGLDVLIPDSPGSAVHAYERLRRTR